MIWILLVFFSASIVLTTDNDTVEWIFALFTFIGAIGWFKHVNRRSGEGGNWLSGKLSKSSVDEIARQQLAEEESGLPHIIIDPSLIDPSDRVHHDDHEFDFCCGKCECLYADFICKGYEEPHSFIGGAVEFFLFSIPRYFREKRWEKAWGESFFICKDCGNQQPEGYPRGAYEKQ